jgi:hypothetical protein
MFLGLRFTQLGPLVEEHSIPMAGILKAKAQSLLMHDVWPLHKHANTSLLIGLTLETKVQLLGNMISPIMIGNP